MLKSMKFVLACTLALCAMSMTASFAQDTPPATPPAADKPKTPTMEEARQFVQAEEFEAAAKAFHQIVTAQPDNAQAWHMLGYSLHASGNLTDALPCHLMAAEFTETAPVASYNVACVYALRNKADKAFEWLNRARDRGFRTRHQIEGDSDMDNIRNDSRFAEFLKSLAPASPDAAPQGSEVDPA